MANKADLDVTKQSQQAEIDRWLMQAALTLGARHLGRAWPNPSVGAVLVHQDLDGPRIIARGITQKGGRPHAERVALDAAGNAARGATLYVSLEPCSHHGKTSPCSDAIVSAGVARVVTSLNDPDPRVSGGGIARLRAAGLGVTTGVMAREAGRAHRGHILRVTQGRPSVTVKLAMTADGFSAYAASHAGQRLMISGAAAQADVHLMRAHADSVMVGISTVVQDDPMLTVRLPGMEDRSPIRIVLDSHLKLARAPYKLVSTAHETATWVLTTPQASADAVKLLQTAGIEVLQVEANLDGRVDLHAALKLLAARGITSVFCEGGPQLAEALAQADLIDELVQITAPHTLTEPGLPAFGASLRHQINHVFSCYNARQLGVDHIKRFERNS